MIPTHILIHHSLTADGQTVSWDAIRRYHVETNGWKDIGYQVGIELIGDTYEALLGRMLNENGAHCKEGGMNFCSIGICCAGNFDIEIVPAAQMDKLVQVTRSFMEIFKIGNDLVKRHHDYAGYKSCPGTKFQWSEFKGRLL